jgi:lysophospholipase L1-like esterase
MLSRLKFWAALPFVLPQALSLRKSAPRFAAAAGNPYGSSAFDASSARRLRLLGIGDSIIAGVGATQLSQALIAQTARALAQTQSCPVDWQVLGQIGLDAGQIWRQLVPKLPPHAFDLIVVSTGVNDVTGITSTRAWRRNLTGLVQALHRHSPEALLLLLGVPPMGQFPLLPAPLRQVIGLRAQILDKAARAQLAQYRYVRYVPLDFDLRPGQFSADGYHPSEASYAELGDLLAATITRCQTHMA